jgi:insulysin
MHRLIFILFLVCIPLLATTEQTSLYKIIEDKAGLTIATPDLAKRVISKIRLENGLEALLISDPETHESGAALAVGVGSWDDPQDRPGMAHFVEHLLFLGTEKYPEEAGYTRYLDEHGGSRNAFTMSDRTVYSFSVNNGGFLEALDRFGQFFVAPLFNPSGVARECKAIHSEFCRNMSLDPWRALYVKKELANTTHPFHAFCIGNNDSLAMISQEELKQWYRDHYSANLMHLVVYSSLNLDALEKEVLSIFSAVPNQSKDPSIYSQPLMSKRVEAKLCAITPIQDVRYLELTWEIPRFYGQDREIHADKLLGHVLGHEGSTSLLALLKRENLAEGLGVSNFRAGHDQCLLSLVVQLTDKGVHEYQTVIQRCFEGISTIRQSGIPLYIFDEVCQLEEMRYRFQSRQDIFDLVSDYAKDMLDEPLATFPRQTLIPSVYSSEKIEELIAWLSPKTCQYTLVAPPAVSKIPPTMKEKWFGVEYSWIPLSLDQITTWTQVTGHRAVSIPRPNPFLPTSLSLKSEQEEKTSLLPQPKIIINDSLGLIYAARDTQFLVPEVSWTFLIKTPLVTYASPLSHVFADLYCHTVAEQLNALSYEALTAGLSFSLKPKQGGLELKIKGYNDKAADFLKTIISTMKTANPTQEQFDLYYELLARDYVNSLNIDPLKQGGELMWSILYQDFAGLEQKVKVLSEVSYVQMRKFCQNILKNCYVQGMLYGNLTETEAFEICDTLKRALQCQPYPLADHPLPKLASLPDHSTATYLTLPSQHPAHALILAADCGPFSFKKRAVQEILTKGLEEPFFSELRTRQQTAYVISNWSQEIERHLYSFFAIQSSSHDSRDLLARFELFLENSLQHLREEVIPQERFESIRTACIHQLQHPVENLSKMGSFLHTLAFDYDGDFHWLDKRIEALSALTYDEFVTSAHTFLGKGNTRRLGICVQGILPQPGHLAYRLINSPQQLRNAITYEGRITTDKRGAQQPYVTTADAL